MNKYQIVLSNTCSLEPSKNQTTENEFLKRKKIKILEIKKAKNNENNILKGKWEKDEHNRFLEICQNYGNNWPKVNKL